MAVPIKLVVALVSKCAGHSGSHHGFVPRLCLNVCSTLAAVPIMQMERMTEMRETPTLAKRN